MKLRMKSKVLKLLAMVMIFTVMLSTNTFAMTTQDDNLEIASLQDGDDVSTEFNTHFTDTTIVYGEEITLTVYVSFELDYTYQEGSWVYVRDYNIDVTSATFEDENVPVRTIRYYPTDLGAEEVIFVNNFTYVTIGIRVDEYGDVTTYAHFN